MYNTRGSSTCCKYIPWFTFWVVEKHFTHTQKRIPYIYMLVFGEEHWSDCCVCVFIARPCHIRTKHLPVQSPNIQDGSRSSAAEQWKESKIVFFSRASFYEGQSQDINLTLIVACPSIHHAWGSAGFGNIVLKLYDQKTSRMLDCRVDTKIWSLKYILHFHLVI